MNVKIALGLGAALLLAACGGNNEMPKSCEEMISWHMEKNTELYNKKDWDVLDERIFSTIDHAFTFDMTRAFRKWGDKDFHQTDFIDANPEDITARVKKYFEAKIEEIETEKGKKSAELFREEVDNFCQETLKSSKESIEKSKAQLG